MTTFCTKCGASLPSETGFCPQCGAPIAASTTPATYTPPPSTVAQPPIYTQTPPPFTPTAYPPAAYSPAPPPSSGGSGLKIVLIIVAVVVGLGIIGAGILGVAAYKVSRAVRNSANGDVTFNTPNGSFSAGKNTNISEADLGLPLYPGAAHAEGGMNIHTGDTSVVTAIFTTSDSPTQVASFYTSKLGPNASTVTSDNTIMLTSGHNDNDKEAFMITITADPKEDNGKTKLTIMHTKKS